MTFANATIVGSGPFGLFVSKNNNTVAATSVSSSSILIWEQGNTLPRINLSGIIQNSYSIFLSDTNDVYVDNGLNAGQVSKCAYNLTNCQSAMTMCNLCLGIFISERNDLYCSRPNYHQVVSKQLGSNSVVWNVVAGTGINGSALDQLNTPYGLFVNTNLDLYVADFNNNRIEKFPYGQATGLTVAGDASTITLSRPSSVVLDLDGYLFIVDGGNHRLIGSGPTGFRCITACSLSPGSTPDTLYNPATMSFDSLGNIYVTDQTNDRIQKFILTQNSCGKVLSDILFHQLCDLIPF